MLDSGETSQNLAKLVCRNPATVAGRHHIPFYAVSFFCTNQTLENIFKKKNDFIENILQQKIFYVETNGR